MIDVVHTKQGKSFMGLVSYLLEGEKGHENPDRVAWTATRNLATGRPRMAARVMAATAMDQGRLKHEAGVSNRGRKSNNHVLHYTLSPEAELGRKLTREEWMEAIDGSLAAIGEKAGQKGGRKGKKGRTAVRDQFANEHQVLIVGHQDTDELHVHIVVNRVHPEHGVMLPSSDDFLKLSRWAQKFQSQHGDRSTPQREINNEQRDKGQKVYADKRKPRDVFELEEHARDNRPDALQLQAEQHKKDAALARKSAETRQRCRDEWKVLEADHRGQLRTLEEGTTKEINTQARAIQEQFDPRRKDLHQRQQIDVGAFERKEDTLLGKAANALKSLVSLSGGANVLWSQGARIEAFEKKQRREKLELEREERRLKREAKARIQAKMRSQKIQIGHSYRLKRVETILRHQMEKAAVRADWNTRITERKAAWEQLEREFAARPPEKQYGRQTVHAGEATKGHVESAEPVIEEIQRSKSLKERRKRNEERERGDDGIVR